MFPFPKTDFPANSFHAGLFAPIRTRDYSSDFSFSVRTPTTRSLVRSELGGGTMLKLTSSLPLLTTKFAIGRAGLLSYAWTPHFFPFNGRLTFESAQRTFHLRFASEFDVGSGCSGSVMIDRSRQGLSASSLLRAELKGKTIAARLARDINDSWFCSVVCGDSNSCVQADLLSRVSLSFYHRLRCFNAPTLGLILGPVEKAGIHLAGCLQASFSRITVWARAETTSNDLASTNLRVRLDETTKFQWVVLHSNALYEIRNWTLEPTLENTVTFPNGITAIWQHTSKERVIAVSTGDKFFPGAQLDLGFWIPKNGIRWGSPGVRIAFTPE
jgi:hypothetical protein